MLFYFRAYTDSNWNLLTSILQPFVWEAPRGSGQLYKHHDRDFTHSAILQLQWGEWHFNS